MKIEYSVHYEGYARNDGRYFLKRTNGVALKGSRQLAETCAEDFHQNHDGWDASWPLRFVLFGNDEFLGEYVVDRVAVPQFEAREAAKP